jgi:hypothetical protein
MFVDFGQGEFAASWAKVQKVQKVQKNVKIKMWCFWFSLIITLIS